MPVTGLLAMLETSEHSLPIYLLYREWCNCNQSHLQSNMIEFHEIHGHQIKRIFAFRLWTGLPVLWSSECTHAAHLLVFYTLQQAKC